MIAVVSEDKTRITFRDNEDKEFLVYSINENLFHFKLQNLSITQLLEVLDFTFQGLLDISHV